MLADRTMTYDSFWGIYTSPEKAIEAVVAYHEYWLPIVLLVFVGAVAGAVVSNLLLNII